MICLSCVAPAGSLLILLNFAGTFFVNCSFMFLSLSTFDVDKTYSAAAWIPGEMRATTKLNSGTKVV